MGYLFTRRDFIKAVGLGGSALVASDSLASYKQSQDLPVIQTADTIIKFSCSDDTGPMISACGPVNSAGGSCWQNWIRQARETELPKTIDVGGRSYNIRWKYAGFSYSGREVTFKYQCNNPDLILLSGWKGFSGPGPIEHTMQLLNNSSSTVMLSALPTIALEVLLNRARELWWVEQSEGVPSNIGTHTESIGPGFSRTLESGPNITRDDKSRDAIPWFCIHDPEGKAGLYGGIEFSGFSEITLTADHNGCLRFTAGLYRRGGESRFCIFPGETFKFPTCFIGSYKGSVDDGCNRLHRWIKKHLRPQSSLPLPLLANNTWTPSIKFDIDETKARHMIDDCVDLGIELFEVDAGWFTRCGDWNPDISKFPGGLRPVADYAHSRGIKFGLWIAWTHGATHRTDGLNVLSPYNPLQKSWFTHDYPAGWRRKVPWEGAPVCLGSAEARQWCLQQLRRLITEYDLDVLRQDQIVVVDNCQRGNHNHLPNDPADASYRTARGYYEIYDRLRAEFPNLIFEGCNGGGRTADFGFLKRVHYYQIEDSYFPLNTRRAFYDASFPFPQIMLLQWIRNGPADESLTAFKYRLRSAMLGCCSIQMDTTAWSDEHRKAAKQQFAMYKKHLRGLIASADIYHVLPRPAEKSWDGIEYFDSDSGRGALIVFRAESEILSRRVLLRGLNAQKLYLLNSVDGMFEDMKVSGRQLGDRGLVLRLPEKNSSDIILFRELTEDMSKKFKGKY
ncbi:MAG: glycoside hydrolase family 36 protein [Planctomycetota bacterium]|jgi:hypothetical protein